MLKNKNKAFSKEFIGIIYYTYNGANELEFIIKAVFKCPLAEAKLSNGLLKLIFQRKCMKIGCMIFEVKIRLMIFFIFLSVL